MTGADALLLIAYLCAVATVWVTAKILEDLWKNRKL